MPRSLVAVLLVLFWSSGCKDRPGSSADGSDGPALPDGGTGSDGTIAALALDISVTGCAAYDLAAGRCSGPAPLTVSFSPVGSQSLTRFLWDFGDGTPSSYQRAPTHTYQLPGDFDVTLVAEAPTGSVSRTRRQFIRVNAAGLGQLCDVDTQCATGLRCVCGATQDCGGQLSRGLCTTECSDGSCTGGALCADLTQSIAGDLNAATSPFRRHLCLARCATDEDCALGLTCRDLPGEVAFGQPPWVRGCFARFPKAIGESCRASDGMLSASSCATGQCTDLGALGACTASCADNTRCPTKTACALLADGRTLCLAACTTSDDCGRDPLLGCEFAGAPGPLGFTLPPGAPASGLCAPRSCAADADCAPSGHCANSHCVR